MYKIIVIGDMGTGKTSFVSWVLKGKSYFEPMPTVGIQLGMRMFIQDKTKKQTQLQFWDTAGQERFRSVCYQHYKNAHTVLLFFDVTNRKSFQSLPSWLKDINQYVDNQDVLICLIGNKIEKKQLRQIPEQQILDFIKANNIGFYEQISIYTGDNLEETLQHILEFTKTKQPQSYGQIVESLKPQNRHKKCCHV